MGVVSRVREWNRRTNRRSAAYHTGTPTRRWLLRGLLPRFLAATALAVVLGAVVHGDWTRWLFLPVPLAVLEWVARALVVADSRAQRR